MSCTSHKLICCMQILDDASKKTQWRPLPARVLELEAQGLQLPELAPAEREPGQEAATVPVKQRKRRCVKMQHRLCPLFIVQIAKYSQEFRSAVVAARVHEDLPTNTIRILLGVVQACLL